MIALRPGFIERLKARLSTKWSRHAFNCRKCPKQGCPWWSEFQYHDGVQGQQRFEGCGIPIMEAKIDMALSFGEGTIEAVESQSKDVQRTIAGAVQQARQIEARRELKVLSSSAQGTE